ncbi:MAG TPA: dihydroorotase [Rectinema sp.]|nr:dihydroorotase [Rectinema sp.]
MAKEITKDKADIDRFDMPLPDDFHAHLRQGALLKASVLGHAGQFARVLLMPNTLPPIASPSQLKAYRSEIDQVLAELPLEKRFEPLYTFKLLPGMKGYDIEALVQKGAIAGKYYPSGSTTNAADGPRSFDEVEDALNVMEEMGLVLCIHGEDPSAPILERERAFLPQVERLILRHPSLHVVLEHLSDARSVRFVQQGPQNLAATITAHHLLFTLDDMMADSLNPHLYCKPVLKFARDRNALRMAVLSGSNKFFFGSDSAPHPRGKKECSAAASGVYSAPTALPALVELFADLGGLDQLVPFLSENGARFYGLAAKPSVKGNEQQDEDSRSIAFQRMPWTVPETIDGLVPMCASQRLSWRVV